MKKTTTQIILHPDLERIAERRDGESKKGVRAGGGMKTKKRKIAKLRQNLEALTRRTSRVLLWKREVQEEFG